MSSQSQPLSPQKASKSVKGKLRFSRKQKNPTGEMTLVEHLQELRRRGGEFDGLWRMQAEGFNRDTASGP